MNKRPLSPTDLSQHIPDPEDDQIQTVLMSGKGSEHVFDDLRQRYERRVESQEHRLLEGHERPAPLQRRADPSNSELSIEPATPRTPPEADVPWYAWMLVAASFVLLTVAAISLVVLAI
ncbi:MAG: hypothetical protein AAF602_03315 [Myxococcota bacterium]